MILLSLLAAPFVFGLAAFFLGKRRITVFELAIQLVVASVLMVGGYYLTRWGGLQDYELWSGRIASTPSMGTNCCHSYKCNCRQECTTTEGETKCQEVCDTCYEHAGDTRYEAVTSNGETVYSSGCWAPGEGPPLEWSRIRIGEPTVVEHRFTNYVKADPSELVAQPTGTFPDLPSYPQVRGWRARRWLFDGVTINPAELLALDGALDELNADLGMSKQVNLIVVVTRHEPAYFEALAWHWLGGKKNDVVIVIGAPAFPAIGWARVMAWNVSSGGEDELKGAIAARVQALGRFDGERILAILREEVVRGYRRRSFSELEYLMARAQPPGWAVGVLFGIGLLISTILHAVFWRNRRRMTGEAPHRRVQRFFARAGAWWRWRPDAEPPLVASDRVMTSQPVAAFDPPASGERGDAHVSGRPTFLVSLQTIEALEPIANADRLVRATVGGRTVVVRSDQFAVGDRCVYFEPGCVLPDAAWSSFLSDRDFRVEVSVIRGVRSDGLALPVTMFTGSPSSGVDLASSLGVVWGRPIA